MQAVTVDRAQGEQLFEIETAEAWFEYLEQTRRLARTPPLPGQPSRYEELEPWAWARLETALRSAKDKWRRGLANRDA